MIKLNDLAIGYNGEAILEHIDQEFDDGLIYGILAKSGAGKTTHGIRSRSTKRKIVSRLVMARNLSSSCRASSSSHVTKLLQSAGIWAALIVQSKAGITVWAMLLKLTRWQS